MSGCCLKEEVAPERSIMGLKGMELKLGAVCIIS